jgi:hypothetical protein
MTANTVYARINHGPCEVRDTQFVSVLDRLHIGSMTTIQNLDALKHLVSELEGLAGQPAA